MNVLVLLALALLLGVASLLMALAVAAGETDEQAERIMEQLKKRRNQGTTKSREPHGDESV